ncbi:hypothetical protein AVEN_33872-1 [Araneus ventricosus]|uniref:Uncharacterized protein n=1 Tax=Araneus ventricosus TaxID=182803 RepID=A0A4Y2JY74_ARAVE|nr:hypothetical protein AVEN_33872-1 [Araneus ventricosus]
MDALLYDYVGKDFQRGEHQIFNYVHQNLPEHESFTVPKQDTDAERRLLQQPYDVPFKVFHKKEKVYNIQVTYKPTWISINRLERAFGFIEPSASIPASESR